MSTECITRKLLYFKLKWSYKRSATETMGSNLDLSIQYAHRLPSTAPIHDHHLALPHFPVLLGGCLLNRIPLWTTNMQCLPIHARTLHRPRSYQQQLRQHNYRQYWMMETAFPLYSFFLDDKNVRNYTEGTTLYRRIWMETEQIKVQWQTKLRQSTTQQSGTYIVFHAHRLNGTPTNHLATPFTITSTTEYAIDRWRMETEGNS